MATRRVCIVTGTRAEYGLLYWLMREVQEDSDLELQIVATGMHLSPEFGLTYQEIEEDGFEISEKVEMLTSSDTPVGIAKSMGLGTIGFADALNRLDPDVLVVLGDRYEILSVAQAALVARIPIAHLHGGEATKGLIDDPIRHALTKLSHYHFVSADSFRKRVIQMGEHPDRVFTVGAPGLDNFHRMELLERDVLEQSIDFELGGKSCIVTYHPVTLSQESPAEPFEELLAALSEITDLRIIFTKSNSDTEGRVINQMIDEYVQNHPDRSCAFTSLGQKRYLSALQHVGAVVGNSSSGIIEAPAVPVPTVNLGDRQGGRLRAESVIDCEEDREQIYDALRQALSPAFQEKVQNATSPYGDGHTSLRIKKKLKEAPLNEDVLKKGFYDLNGQ
ncbi:UDP-N-acetylglucosamine 2-epimerase [Salinibacter ruber]|uniref:UDP-N-acetylglucosamine 2-epimerase n=1 Tax=Salinibacter ruber TaxID=146919 RepID=UPI00216A7ADD|nr:UDP-N-acetylglucosamine 2-epimerase [Salinibacter ruber]MCS4174466.1 UDP-N-acetylglucosamine 2-epimerase (non-hydrolyzing)/GDP/UDP-N,N'-diacetylbacillosamine 2-epimerase (hydrolyzing) [Salinibacter ruber]